MVVPQALFDATSLLWLDEWAVWYSGVPLVIGTALAAVDRFLLPGQTARPSPACTMSRYPCGQSGTWLIWSAS